MYISLFNTEKVSEEPFQNGLMLDRFAPSVTMSTYLVAFVVCDFGSEFAYTKKSNIKVNIPIIIVIEFLFIKLNLCLFTLMSNVWPC